MEEKLSLGHIPRQRRESQLHKHTQLFIGDVAPAPFCTLDTQYPVIQTIHVSNLLAVDNALFFLLLIFSTEWLVLLFPAFLWGACYFLYQLSPELQLLQLSSLTTPNAHSMITPSSSTGPPVSSHTTWNSNPMHKTSSSTLHRSVLAARAAVCSLAQLWQHLGISRHHYSHSVSLLWCLINCGITADVAQKVQEVASGLSGIIFSGENLNS